MRGTCSRGMFCRFVGRQRWISIPPVPLRAHGGGCGDRGGTLFALSSAPGRSGVAVIRVSGPQAGETLRGLTGSLELPPARSARLRRLRDPASGETLDRGLVLWFPGPHSFTGEDSCEFHVHGGSAVIRGVLESLGSLPGLHPAEPGAFARRAFFHGKLDLTAIEGLGDLVQAETASQRRQALRQLDGELGKLYSAWRERLAKCLAHVEAYIDFNEDDNIEDNVLDEVAAELAALRLEIEAHLKDGLRGERLRSGLDVVIAGATNAGKSSLLNALCKRPVAIVTPIAGTTRDVLETTLDLSGFPVMLSDTAGLRASMDPVEREGVRRALQRLNRADVVVVVVDVMEVDMEHPVAALQNYVKKVLQGRWEEEEQQEEGRECTHPYWTCSSTVQADWHTTNGQLRPEKELCPPQDREVILVLNKVDLLDSFQVENLRNKLDSTLPETSFISCKTGDSLDTFVSTLEVKVETMCGDPIADSPSLTQARHRTHLIHCLSAIKRYQERCGWLDGQLDLDSDRQPDTTRDTEPDLAIEASNLRGAMHELGHITGHVTPTEVLDIIFRDFCIGK